MNDASLTYRNSGVDTDKEQQAMRNLKKWVEATFHYNSSARVCLELGYFANVLDIGNHIGIAISTDGVGTKILVAEELGRFDTIGIDCVAMNVNDILCVGARPLSMVDYIAVQKISPEFLDQIGIGLQKGARIAGISIPAGELAQVPEMIQGVNNGSAFDLVGTAIGVVNTDNIITGSKVQPGDVVIGLPSSGIHSNGFTLARKSLLVKGRMKLSEHINVLDKSLGDELLVPTRIYVKEVFSLLESGICVKALVHITGDGLTNLSRIEANVGFDLDAMPEPPPIFSLIQEMGRVPVAEMYTVYNMGIGFCVIVDRHDVKDAVRILERSGPAPVILGTAVDDPEKKIILKEQGIIGIGNKFLKSG